MPWILLLLFFGYRYMTRREKLAARPRLIIDPNMPSSLREEVIRAMEIENDPKTLSEFAEALTPNYPRASYELRMKAWVASGRQGPLPSFPTLAG